MPRAEQFGAGSSSQQLVPLGVCIIKPENGLKIDCKKWE
jgi:hypothetical protein